MKWSGMDFKDLEAKNLMGLKVHQDGVKKINPLERWSASTFVM